MFVENKKVSKIKIFIVLMVVINLLLPILSLNRIDATGSVPTPVPLVTNYFLGNYYMPKPPNLTNQFHENYAHNRTPLVTSENRRVKPLLGYYDTSNPTLIDWQIKFAVENGINYWVFDDYWTGSQTTPNFDYAVDAFLKSQYKGYLQFANMITEIDINYWDPVKVKQKLITDIAARYKNLYFQQPNYLKINGKPAVYVFSNSRFGSGGTNVTQIADMLSSFETAVGQEVYWVYATPNSSEANFNHYKLMGYDALQPYGINPSLGNPEGITYASFVQQSFDRHVEFFSKAASAGLKFLPTISTNFDERQRYYVDSFISPRGFSTNTSTALYLNLVTAVKNAVDWRVQNSPPAIEFVNGKPVVGLGPWNEWFEGGRIEPGITELNQSDPFAVLNGIAKVFKPDYVPNNPALATIPDFSMKPEYKYSWNFSNPAESKKWYTPPNATNIIAIAGENKGKFIIDNHQSYILDGEANVNLDMYRGVRMYFSATCANSTDCLSSIFANWYTTNCSSDTNASCTDPANPNKSGTVGLAHKTSPNCVNKSTDQSFGYCDFIAPANDPGWTGRLERLRFVFYTRQNHPTEVVVGDIVMLPKTCRGDYDLNGEVAISDFAQFGQNYKKATGLNCALDLKGNDCFLNINDFAEFGRIYKSVERCSTQY